MSKQECNCCGRSMDYDLNMADGLWDEVLSEDPVLCAHCRFTVLGGEFSVQRPSEDVGQSQEPYDYQWDSNAEFVPLIDRKTNQAGEAKPGNIYYWRGNVQFVVDERGTYINWSKTSGKTRTLNRWQQPHTIIDPHSWVVDVLASDPKTKWREPTGGQLCFGGQGHNKLCMKLSPDKLLFILSGNILTHEGIGKIERPTITQTFYYICGS